MSEAAATVLFMGTMNEGGGMKERKGKEGKGGRKGWWKGRKQRERVRVEGREKK